jgi:hypothetical protein
MRGNGPGQENRACFIEAQQELVALLDDGADALGGLVKALSSTLGIVPLDVEIGGAALLTLSR